MIHKLRKRFISIAILSLVVTLTVLVAAVNLVHYRSVAQSADAMIQVLYENDGAIPQPPHRLPGDPFRITEETPFETRYFIVYMDDQENVLDMNTDNIAAVDWQRAEETISEISRSKNSSGFMGQYRYGVFQTDAGSTIIVLDRYLQIQSLMNVLKITLLVSGVCILCVFVFLLILSERVMRPFAKNLEKQQRFVTDAGHELKTPLTIISASTDVMELETGDSQWLRTIRNQTSRLDTLVQSLVELAQADEEQGDEKFQRFPLSDAVRDAVQSFELVIKSQEKKLSVEVQDNLTYLGDEEMIVRLVSILMDNAIKYSPSGGSIAVELHRRGRGVVLTVSNTVEQVESDKLARLFDRFYRTEDSRSRDTGGYGIGLSIAQAIVQKHKGKIWAEYIEGNRIAFIAVL